MTETVTLWRPTGPRELALVPEAGFRAWPPRLPDQPIFYPVLNEEYATRIARDWNVPSSGVGYVTRFEVTKAFMDRYEVHQLEAFDPPMRTTRPNPPAPQSALMFGDESGLGTPEEDMASLAAVNSLETLDRIVVSVGFGIDAIHGVDHTQVPENLATLRGRRLPRRLLDLPPLTGRIPLPRRGHLRP